ncbi:MAG TPA: UDP-N-acetylmuramate--L-alanine ligase [Gemmatimonadaceae bacterium]|nr:UDP-N-acetylmuramate--L-alanine ligase [Gemmatimonadaceae bacterium]
MSLLDRRDPRPVHFVGIAGAGMRALAELLARRGVRVTGCDAAPGDVDDLRALGIDVRTGHDPVHVDEARAVVVTSAMPKTHPELERARALGCPVIRRAEALGEATANAELVAVAGTHGKSTTTVMATQAMAAAGLDPTALVGARVAEWKGNLRAGGTALYVVEADEYDRSFLALAPTVAVITNIEADHLDIYRDLDDIRGAFAQFASGARAVVVSADDPVASTLPLPQSADVVRFGLRSSRARLTATDLRAEHGGTRFDVRFDGARVGTVALRVPGTHNVLNALAALGAGMAEGRTVAELAPGLESFGGVERRFQRVGDAAGVAVVDDYAHHPTEIAATVAAARAAFPGRRLVVAFQPHLYSRTRDFAGAFASALAGADALFLADIYPAREQPIPGVSADLIADALGDARVRLQWRGDRAGLAPALAAFAQPGDVVVTMGAGDVTRSAPELVRLLGAR